MTTAAVLRNRYARESISTASPARLVTMLYDRLVRDLVTAETALAARDLGACSGQLVHAQAIVAELSAGLDTTLWEGAKGLAALYVFLSEELVAANMSKDGGRIVACREIVEPLREAWHEAANASHEAR
jgi:flagellar secretion chaperone FliS